MGRAKPEPAKPQWVTLYIGKGKKDKINKVDIVGFLSKVGGLGKSDIGRIDVKEHYAFVAIRRKFAKRNLGRRVRTKDKRHQDDYRKDKIRLRVVSAESCFL